MEPVEIDIRLKQNVDTESEKAVKGVDNISNSSKAATEAVQAAGKNTIEAVNSQIEKTKATINNLETVIVGLKTKMNDAVPGNDKQSAILDFNEANRSLNNQKTILAGLETSANEVKKTVRETSAIAGNAGSEVANIGKNTVTITKQAIKEQQQLIKEISSDIKNINAELSKNPKNKSLEADLTGAKKALLEEQGTLVGMQRQQLDADNASVTSQGGIISSLGKWAIGLMSVGAAMEIGKKIMESTESTTHAWEIVTESASSATGYLFKTIATGDWSNFTDGMQRAIQGAKDYVKWMEQVQNKTNEQKIKSSSLDIKIGEARADSYSTDPKVVKQALKTIIALQTEKLTGEANIAKQSYEVKRKKIADDNNWNELELENTIKYYTKNKEIIEKGELYNSLSKQLKQVDQAQRLNPDDDFSAQRNKISKEISTLGADAASAGKLASSLSKVTFTQRNELTDLLAKSQDAQAAININNRRDKQRLVGIEKTEQDKADAEAKKVQEARKKAIKEQSDYATEIGKKRIQNSFEIEQELLNVEENGSEKSIKQADLDYRKRISAIEIQKADFIKKQNELSGGIDKTTGKPTKKFSAVIPVEDQQQFDALEETALKVKNAKVLEINKKDTEKLLSLYTKYGDERTKIEEEYNGRIEKLVKGGFIVAASELATERDKKISAVSKSLIEETDLYKMATDERFNIGKKLNEKLANQIKERVNDELAAGKLTQADAKKILDSVDKSQTVKVSGSLSDYISTLGKLKKAKEDLAKAKVSGDLEGAIKAGGDIENLSKSVETYGQKLQNVFSEASNYAGQAVGLLDAISTEEGDAASSASKSISTVMNIAGNAVSSLAKGDYVGAAISVITGTLTAIFSAEKAHQQALAAIAKAKADTQKEYNDLLMKQNDLLEKAKTIFGTSQLDQANAYAASMAAYSKAKNSAIQSLSGATVQTGSHKTGLFGWGGEKADYSSLLSQYPKLVDAQGNLNTELAQSILANEKLNDSSKQALQSALDYSDDYKKALEDLQNYLSGIFGSLTEDLMTSITDNLSNEKDAIDEFSDYVGKAMKKMISDLAEKLFFAKMFNDLSDQVTKIYSDSSLTDKQKADAATTAVGNFYNGIGSAVSNATDFINGMYSSVKDKTGIDLSSSAERTGTSKAISTASQDSIDELSGGVYAIRTGVADIRNYDKERLLIERTMTSQLGEIVYNTSFLEDMAKDISDIKTTGIKVKL